ncbi:MAG: SusD/RagB family nutrient-binding outer membrane lipoprotein [Saprospiraceae bacterium]
MKSIYKFLLPLLVFTAFSCEDFLDVNDNPNQLVDVPSGDLLLKGTLLANTQLHKGHLMRAASYYSGGLIGNNLVQQTLYIYNFTPGDSDGSWEHLYNGILAQNKKIRELSPELDRLQGIVDINEAMALGTAASIWGDIPYTTAVPDNPTLESALPVYDAQATVFGAVQELLDAGIEKLADPKTNVGSEDIFNGGNATKWTQAAYTLKARNYMLTKNYGAALNQVDKGISSAANDLAYHPIGTINENSNLIYILANGSRAGDMTGEDAYLQQLLDPANTSSRNNAKTDETARRNFLFIKGDGSSDKGIDAQDADMPLVTYAENTLIWESVW